MKNFCFDLDGTLLSTIDDIAEAINDALAACGYPFRYDSESVKPLLGDGSDMLVHRSLKNLDNPESFAKVKKAFFPRYLAYQGHQTHPFDGIVEVLETMAQNGCNLFVTTNKPDPMAQAIVKKTLPASLFRGIYGHKEGDPVKPNPIQVTRIFASGEFQKEETLYVGDSHVDIETARNAGIPVALCLWGYDQYNDTLLAKADFVLQNPYDILRLFSKS